MTVKVGDIVQYNGQAQRIMTVSNGANTVCYTRTSPLYGPLIVIDDGREFQTYHLEPIYPYDMI